MEWKDKFPKNTKPPYSDLLDFFRPHIRDLFLQFDKEMQKQFNVANKYQRYLTTAGWVYGYGTDYNCELLAVTVQSGSFGVLGVSVTDEASLQNAIAAARAAYDNGFEERYAEICKKRRENQIARTKKRIAREKAEMEKLNAGAENLNKFKWCKKTSRHDLYRLYVGESKGMLDENLLDDVGLSFYVRCQQAKEARECMANGEIVCHHCNAVLKAGRVSPTGTVLIKPAGDSLLINCNCGHSYTYREYRRSFCAANMPAGRATPVFEHFREKWPTCKSTKDKMLLIDWLIHQCHTDLMSDLKGRSVCVNLIEGSKKQITELILKLAYE